MRKNSGGATKAVVGVADCIAHLTMGVLVIVGMKNIFGEWFFSGYSFLAAAKRVTGSKGFESKPHGGG
jgi:hypothetical protein